MITDLSQLCQYLGADQPGDLNHRVDRDYGASITLHYADGLYLCSGDRAAHTWELGEHGEHTEITDPSRNWQSPGAPIAFSFHTIVEGTDAEFDSRRLHFGQVSGDDVTFALVELEEITNAAWVEEYGDASENQQEAA